MSNPCRKESSKRKRNYEKLSYGRFSIQTLILQLVKLNRKLETIKFQKGLISWQHISQFWVSLWTSRVEMALTENFPNSFKVNQFLAALTIGFPTWMQVLALVERLKGNSAKIDFLSSITTKSFLSQLLSTFQCLIDPRLI